VKTPFEQFAAWRLAPSIPAFLRLPQDNDAQHRWEGEGGNTEIAGTHRKRRSRAGLGRWHAS
jgi:hypothetical protein